MKYIEIKAPAKINFGLNIIEKRSDGYHNLHTIFYPINELFDELSFTKSDKFTFSCNDKTIENELNLVVKAKKLLEIKSERKLNVEIELLKNIPMGGGLGGGSSDAAAVLLALNDMFHLGFSFDKLQEFGLELGSDVPFFIKPFPSFGEQRGEKLSSLEIEIPSPILIVNPQIHVSTSEAYSYVKPQKPLFDLSNLTSLNIKDFNFLRTNVKNDFENSVFRKFPEIKNLKSQLYDLGAGFVLMSGSGSTIFALFENFNAAQNASINLPDNYFKFINTNL